MKKKLKSKKKPREVLVIKIGDDERPATPDDLINFQHDLASVSGREFGSVTFVVHHAVSFEKVKLSTRKKALVVKVGSSYRPSTREDIEAVKALFEQAELDNSLAVITHHALSFEYIDRVSTRKTKVLNRAIRPDLIMPSVNFASPSPSPSFITNPSPSLTIENMYFQNPLEATQTVNGWEIRGVGENKPSANMFVIVNKD